MTDISDINEQPKLYTEAQIFELFQRFKAEEQATTQRAREERVLPLEIITSLDDVVNAYYKWSEINRIHGRAATELYEQLHTIKGGNLPADQAHQLLDEAIESAKRLAIHAWFHA
ncbi:hypothetical protein G6F37_010753 [Rhizopus arrhizus]|nr:hypothetical protein G6F38_010663 [Rhizopus arrhizus]KAG1152755.1 hypothetical protein G6F37_010753 [Rhizopus arrhizus]